MAQFMHAKSVKKVHAICIRGSNTFDVVKSDGKKENVKETEVWETDGTSVLEPLNTQMALCSKDPQTYSKHT